jgi:glycosyltransferase involved in cell wall biosynthesis
MRSPPALVSVIVPARDAESTLPEQLASLRGQDYPGDYEIVVADHGSRDATPRLVKQLAAEDGRVRYVAAAGRRAAGGVRNAGVALARGSLLAFTDADDVADRRWLSALARAAPAWDAVAGRVDRARLNHARTRAWNLPSPVDGSPFQGFLPIADAANFAVWRDTFESLAGFCDLPPCSEDADLCWRLQLNGGRLGFAPDAMVYGRHRTDLVSHARQSFRYGQRDAWLFSRYARHGMPRHRGPRDALDLWRGLLAGAPRELRSRDSRGLWVRSAALGLGRAVGSVRFRTVYL